MLRFISRLLRPAPPCADDEPHASDEKGTPADCRPVIATLLDGYRAKARLWLADPAYTKTDKSGHAYAMGTELWRAIGCATHGLRCSSARPANDLAKDLVAMQMAYRETYQDPMQIGVALFHELITELETEHGARLPDDLGTLRDECMFTTARLMAVAAQYEAGSDAVDVAGLWDAVLSDAALSIPIATLGVQGSRRSQLCGLQLFVSHVLHVFAREPDLLLKAYACLLALRDGFDVSRLDLLRDRIEGLGEDTQLVEYFVVRDEIMRIRWGRTVYSYVGIGVDGGVVASIRIMQCLSNVDENNREIADYRGKVREGEVESRAVGIKPRVLVTFVGNTEVDLSTDWPLERLGRRVASSIVGGLISHRARVIVVPTGDVLRVPFESLPTSDESLYGLEHAFVYRLHSPLVDSWAPARARSDREPPLVIGGCDFDSNVGEQPNRRVVIPNRTALFEPLPASEQEARSVARMLGVEPQVGVAARKPLIGHAPRVIHLATHAFSINREYHFESEGGESATFVSVPAIAGQAYAGIVFAGANGRQLDDGIEVHGCSLMTPAEIAGLDLSGTDLVVLSSCDSGLGSTETFLIHDSLRASFLAAGARAVVSSFWEISDTGASRFIAALYEQLTLGRRVSDALLAARRATQDLGVTEWGAFAVVGEDVTIA